MLGETGPWKWTVGPYSDACFQAASKIDSAYSLIRRLYIVPLQDHLHRSATDPSSLIVSIGGLVSKHICTLYTEAISSLCLFLDVVIQLVIPFIVNRISPHIRYLDGVMKIIFPSIWCIADIWLLYYEPLMRPILMKRLCTRSKLTAFGDIWSDYIAWLW